MTAREEALDAILIRMAAPMAYNADVSAVVREAREKARSEILALFAADAGEREEVVIPVPVDEAIRAGVQVWVVTDRGRHCGCMMPDGAAPEPDCADCEGSGIVDAVNGLRLCSDPRVLDRYAPSSPTGATNG